MSAAPFSLDVTAQELRSVSIRLHANLIFTLLVRYKTFATLRGFHREHRETSLVVSVNRSRRSIIERDYAYLAVSAALCVHDSAPSSMIEKKRAGVRDCCADEYCSMRLTRMGKRRTRLRQLHPVGRRMLCFRPVARVLCHAACGQNGAAQPKPSLHVYRKQQKR